jgi:hypothetical protein
MHRNPYINQPWWARITQDTLYLAAYVLLAVVGLAAILLVDEWPAREGGWVMVPAAVVAIVGVITRLYNVELVALWPLIAGLLAIVVWMQLNDAQIGGWIIAALIPWMGLRVLVLSLVARDARMVNRGVDPHAVV